MKRYLLGLVVMGLLLGLMGGQARQTLATQATPERHAYMPLAAYPPSPTPTPTPTLTPTLTATPTLTPTPTPTPTLPPPVGTVIPNDPAFASAQWPLTQIRAREGWSISTGAEIVIAVVDTGVDYTHPDLAGKMANPALWYDFINNDFDPMDGHGHGTHVAGIAAAATNNLQGIAGVSWGARILPLKVLSDSGTGPASLLVAAMRHATTSGARVINMSLGLINPPLSLVQSLQQEVDFARASGVVVVAAAGNCHQGATLPSCGNQNDPYTYPAALTWVIAVAATTPSDGHAPYSTEREYVDIAAPGGVGPNAASMVYSTLRGGGYGAMSGTSMAAPHVSGVAALLLSLTPSPSVAQVEAALTNSAYDLGVPGWDPSYGHGRLDMRGALEAAWRGEPAALPARGGVDMGNAGPRHLVRAAPRARPPVAPALGSGPRRRPPACGHGGAARPAGAGIVAGGAGAGGQRLRAGPGAQPRGRATRGRA